MLIKDIISLECVQRRATKYILHDFSSDYKTCLISMNILPLMMQLEINDLMFFTKNLKDPMSTFNVRQFVQFCSSNTRSSTFLKLKQSNAKLNCVRHFYFNRLPRLWNSLPHIDLNLPLYSIHQKLKSFGITSLRISVLFLVLSIIYVHVPNVLSFLYLKVLVLHSFSSICY